MTPAAFEKHSGRETARKWKNNIWVIVDGEKVPIFKTALLKYYNKALKNANGSHRSQTGKPCHRDELIRCSQCNKLRRFRLRSKEECRIYHDILLNANWKCSDMPYDKYVITHLIFVITALIFELLIPYNIFRRRQFQVFYLFPLYCLILTTILCQQRKFLSYKMLFLLHFFITRKYSSQFS